MPQAGNAPAASVVILVAGPTPASRPRVARRRRRAFVACDGNATLVTLALPGVTELGRLDVGDRPDVLAADSHRGVLYVAAESGVLTTVDLRAPAGRVTGRAHLANDAHVVAVGAATGRAYFPVPDAGDGHPGLLITAPTTDGSP
jgi:hypothetical protein